MAGLVVRKAITGESFSPCGAAASAAAATVPELKRLIELQWGVPPACQQLLVASAGGGRASRILGEEEGGEALAALDVVDLVVALEPMLADLAGAGGVAAGERRLAALGSLRHWRPPGGRSGDVALAVARLLVAGAPTERSLAQDVLYGMVRSGDPAVLDALTSGLKREHPFLRRIAVGILKVAEQGNEATIIALIGLLEDELEDIVLKAVEALCDVAPRGHAGATDALASMARRSAGAAAKGAALRALGAVAERGHEATITLLLNTVNNFDAFDSARFLPSHRTLSRIAVEALGQLVDGGGGKEVKTIAAALKNPGHHGLDIAARAAVRRLAAGAPAPPA